MTLLPLIFSLLIAFAIMTGMATRSWSASEREKAVLQGRLRAYHTLDNKREQLKYRLIHTAPSDKEGKTVWNKTYFRKLRCEAEAGKFNLSLLMNRPDGEVPSPAYGVAERLIETLYKRAPFWKEGLATDLLKRLTKHKGASLLSFCHDNAEFGPIFYKMVQGTTTIYPCFFDFFTTTERLKKAESRPLSFAWTPIYTLTAAFGHECATAIAAAETSQKKALSKEDLIAFLTTRPDSLLSRDQLDHVFLFTGNKGEITNLGDRRTGVVFRKGLPEN